MKTKIITLVFGIAIATLQGCISNAITDDFVTIPNQHWTYAQPTKSVVEITNTNKKYNIFINLRHTDAYKYANIWFKVSIIQPTKTKKTDRVEYAIASADGAWLGTTSGSLFTYQLPYKQNYSFAHKGKYIIIVEQNMRDNPLDGINDIGVKVEEIQNQ
jgi:gliding motility-associated lipoprotein GldH